MRTTSNRKLADQLGVSETAVRRAERAGRIKREPDGAWDLAKVRAAWAVNTDPAHQRGEPSAENGSGRVARRAVKPVPEAALGAVRETLREHGEPVSTGSMTFMQARTANEVLKAQERRVRLQRMKGEVVDRAKAVAQVFKLGRDERDAWVNWPARVAAMMAAELEVDPHALHTRSVAQNAERDPAFQSPVVAAPGPTVADLAHLDQRAGRHIQLACGIVVGCRRMPMFTAGQV